MASGFTRITSVLCLLSWLVERHVTVSFLLPFGTDAGDNGTAESLGNSGEIALSTPLIFYQDSYSTIYANVDGFVSFTTGGDVFDVDGDLGSLSLPVICVFCASFVPTSTNQVWYRLSTQVTDIQTIQDLARQYTDFGSTFTPSWVFVVTWDDINTITASDGGNSIQVAVATDGMTSLVLLDYEQISWIEGFISSSSIQTKVGFSKGDGMSFYALPQSQTSRLFSLNSSTNIGTEGQYLYRVDQATIAASPTPITADQSTTAASPTSVSSATSGTTTPDSTTSVYSSQEDESSDDATMYYIGFGVAGGVLVIAGTAFVVYLKLVAKPSVRVNAEKASQ